jgi:hypothetical protein
MSQVNVCSFERFVREGIAETLTSIMHASQTQLTQHED